MLSRKVFFAMGIISGIILFLSVVSTKPCMAQDMPHQYVPFVKEGKKWCFVTDDSNAGHVQKALVFTMSGDTLISGKTYKKVYCLDEKLMATEEQYYCAVREGSDLVYLVELDDNEEILLYDFSRQNEVVNVTRHSCTFARLGGHGLNTYQYDPSIVWEYPLYEVSGDEVLQTHPLGFWIEGIGSVYGNPFAKELYSELNNGYVESCMEGDKYVYQIEWFAEPTSIGRSKVSPRFLVPNFYDLQGRRLTGEPSHGIYIKDGKKVLVGDKR